VAKIIRCFGRFELLAIFPFARSEELLASEHFAGSRNQWRKKYETQPENYGFSSPQSKKQDSKLAAGWKKRRKVFAPLGAGGTHCQHDREQDDYYATHPTAAKLLMEVETFNRNIWECACGQGHLAKVFSSAG
jgi:hypothetical protein